MIACPDRFHQGRVDRYGERYELAWDGMVMVGWRCRTCGFETMQLVPLTTEPKPCPVCGEIFDSDVSVVNEKCPSCFAESLIAFLGPMVERDARRAHIRRMRQAYRRKSA